LSPRRCVLIAVALTALAWSAAAGATAAASLTLAGPTHNALNAPFRYTISGFAAAPADRVVAWEQYNKLGGCAATYAAEKARTPSAAYEISVFVNQAVTTNASYSLVASFDAVHPGTHGICAYLIDGASGATYAYGGAWWTNGGAAAHTPGSGTLTLSGPTANKLNTPFRYTISGSASGGANHVVAWEQYNELGGCADTYEAEKARSGSAAYEISVFVNRAITANASYSLVASFDAVHPGTHGLCAYLTNGASGQTYAHAAAWWTNS
jgi:hypothetical protein